MLPYEESEQLRAEFQLCQASLCPCFTLRAEQKAAGRPQRSTGSGVNVAIIGLLSTSATEPNAGGSLSQPPVVHYGPHSALIRANPQWWAPARAPCQRTSSTQAAFNDRGRFRHVTGGPLSKCNLHTGYVQWGKRAAFKNATNRKQARLDQRGPCSRGLMLSGALGM